MKFVGGKVEPGEAKEQALIREYQEELAILISMYVTYEYPDIMVHLTLVNSTIIEGMPQKLEHNDIRRITSREITNYMFRPTDSKILEKIAEVYHC